MRTRHTHDTHGTKTALPALSPDTHPTHLLPLLPNRHHHSSAPAPAHTRRKADAPPHIVMGHGPTQLAG